VSSFFVQSAATPTPREQELIALIGRGLQNKEIAYELNISQSTVHAHIRNIMRKYRLHNRTQIAVMFLTKSAPSDQEESVAYNVSLISHLVDREIAQFRPSNNSELGCRLQNHFSKTKISRNCGRRGRRAKPTSVKPA
jgi:DNA-binding CsgD family transcriptional regulator